MTKAGVAPCVKAMQFEHNGKRGVTRDILSQASRPRMFQKAPAHVQGKRGLCGRALPYAALMISCQEAHDDVVVPTPGDKGALALTTLLDKAAGAVASDRPFVRRDDAQAQTMELQHVECVGCQQADGLAAQPPTKLSDIVKADRQQRTTVVPVKMVQPGLPKKPAFNFNCPGKRMRHVMFHPLAGVILPVGRHCIRITTKRQHNLRRPSERQPGGNVRAPKRPQTHARAAK